MRDPIVMNHPGIPGQEDKTVERAAYRAVWYQLGWRSDDDPGFTGEGTTLAPASLDQRVGFTPDLRSGSPAEWAERVFSLDAVNTPATALTFEHGQMVARGSGGTSVGGGRRSVFAIPGSPGGPSRIRSRWVGHRTSPASGSIPQHGHAHSLGVQADGKVRCVMVWHDVVFGAPWVFNTAVWETNLDGTGFALTNLASPEQRTVTGGSRTGNVVTLTGLPAGHGFAAGDTVLVNMDDNTYDGTFTLTGVTSTTVTYGQTAADDASAGAGAVTLVGASLTKDPLRRVVASTDMVRASGIVTATVPAGHPLVVGDWVSVDSADNTYDGRFNILTAPTPTTVTWRQAVADDPSAGAGTISKVAPYWVESEFDGVSLRARMWVEGASVPGWESPAAWYAVVADDPAVFDPARGQDCGLLAAHLAGGATPTEVRYDSIEVAAL